MKVITRITATLVLGASLLSPAAMAQENVLQSMVSRMLTSVVEITVDELQNQAAEAVANTAHNISEHDSEIKAKVKVTELTAAESQNNELPKSE
ncbi:hypothetical protein [Alteromonas flava]|uniref:hypothetical protein n=1 Tax=Alteromonas flava TaxID=2048003 RepID=UPI000C29076A|nr:hypothetical protein [Alteromonas flava]